MRTIEGMLATNRLSARYYQGGGKTKRSIFRAALKREERQLKLLDDFTKAFRELCTDLDAEDQQFVDQLFAEVEQLHAERKLAAAPSHGTSMAAKEGA